MGATELLRCPSASEASEALLWVGLRVTDDFPLRGDCMAAHLSEEPKTAVVRWGGDWLYKSWKLAGHSPWCPAFPT